MQSSDTDEPELLSARDTAARLGIKRDTLYAYVSRGLLRSVGVPGSRQRHYRVADVERFRASRGAGHGAPVETLVPVIGSAICLIESGRFYYRGIDAIRLAESATLEEAASLLWGEAIRPPEAPSPTLPRKRGRVARRAVSHKPAGLTRGDGRVGAEIRPGLIERCQIRLAMLAAENPAALDLSGAGVIRTGQTILSDLVCCVGDTAPSPDPAHVQLAAAWHLDASGADLIRRCLVLLADHELNASTFVARCVASTGATPYAVVSAALSALSGRRHGGASARAEALFHEIGRDNDPPRNDPPRNDPPRNDPPRNDPMAVMAARLARDESLPGLGHPLYPEGDPRALAIVAAVTAALPEAGRRIAAIAVAAMELTGQYPNVDFALGAVVTALSLPAGAALGVFVVGRAVGWIAHAIEQYESRVLIRPRARYTGKRPSVW